MDIVNYLNANTVTKEFLCNMSKEYKLQFYFEDTLNRILFYSDRRLTVVNPINKYANSLIVELINGEYKIVCFPMPCLCNRKLFNKTEEFYIYPLYEGTVINIYFSLLDNEWKFGTHRAFNICDKNTWRGVSWKSIVSKMELEYDTLDKSKTYTYNVQDSDIHLFSRKDNFRLLAISCPTGEVEFFDDIQISLREVFENCENSINNYINGGTYSLGYIFRNQYYSFTFESRLMNIILDLLYRPPNTRNRTIRKTFIEYNNDIDFVKLKCYLYDRDLCTFLFPMFEQDFKKITGIMVSLTNYLELVLSTFSYEGTLPKPELLPLYKSYYEKNQVNLKKIKSRNMRISLSDYVNRNKDIFLFYKMFKVF